jgi:hypothetical protein
MGTSMRNTIQALADAFAASVLDALRDMSLEEILAATGRDDEAPRAAKKGAAKRKRPATGKKGKRTAKRA